VANATVHVSTASELHLHFTSARGRGQCGFGPWKPWSDRTPHDGVP